MTSPLDDLVRRALALHGAGLSALPNVVGVGVGERPAAPADPAGPASPEPCLTVYVTRKLPLSSLALHERVPPTVQIEGRWIRTRVIETGPFVHEGERPGGPR